MYEDIVWHQDVLPADATNTLAILSGQPVLRSFYLAGGTGLALQLGHRKSVDLDFFNSDPFSEDQVLADLKPFKNVAVISKASETLHLHINRTKVSFLGYHYPTVFRFATYEGVNVADPRDIAAMKLTAIASRGTRRDFVDLYVLSQRYGLDEITRVFQQKFGNTTFSDVHLKKSLMYFVEAEKEPMPNMLQSITWDQIKQFFLTQVPRLRP